MNVLPLGCERCGTLLGPMAIEGFCPRCVAESALTALPGGTPEENAAQRRFGRVGHFELFEELGRGGMGVVYRARQTGLDREVAVKVLRLGPLSSASERARFQLEATAAAALRHPNIVAIHEVGEADGHAFLAMELVHGRTLADQTREGPLPAEDAAHHTLAIAEAMAHAHSKGILHRDLKPSNVLVDTDGQPRVTDFGLAKRLATTDSATLTLTGQVLGSPGYMPPEQVDPRRGGIGVAGDVYSIGALLYHLLTGRPPFAAATLTAALAQILNEEPVPPRRLNPAVPRDLETVCMKCLAKDPGRRYASAKALAGDLRSFLERRPITARPASAAERLGLWCRRKPALAALSFALTAVLLSGLCGIVWQAQRARQAASISRLNAYAADVGAASLAWRQGDYSRAQSLLEAQRPHDGETDLRGFEWRLLTSLASHQEAIPLGSHADAVTRLDFSPDGRHLASVGGDGSLRLWNVRDRRLSHEFRKNGPPLWWTSFSPDGGTLLSGGEDQRITVNDATSGLALGTFSGIAGAWAHQGRQLVTLRSKPVFWDEEGAVEVYDVSSLRRLRELPVLGKSIGMAPDGRTLALTRKNSGVQLWDIDTGTLLRSEATPNPVWGPVFSPSGRWFAAAGREQVMVWSLREPGAPRMLQGHHLKVWSIVFSPDERRLFSTGSDRSLRAWDTSTWEPTSVRWGHMDEVWSVAASRDGTWLATGAKDGSIRLWPSEAAAPPPPLRHEVFARPVFSWDGSLLATAIIEKEVTNTAIWRTDSRHLASAIPGALPLAFDRAGRLAVWRQRGWEIEWWNVSELARTHEIRVQNQENRSAPRQLALSPNAAFGVAVETDGAAKLFDPSTGRTLGSLKAPPPFWRSIAVSESGGRVALSRENETRAWLLDFFANEARPLPVPRLVVSGVAFSPDGARVATGCTDARIRIWNAVTGRNELELPGHLEDATDVAFSPDGLTLASIGFQDNLKLWHLATRRETAEFPLPRGGSQLIFSPDGRHLAATLGGMVNEGVELFTVPAHETLHRPGSQPAAR